MRVWPDVSPSASPSAATSALASPLRSHKGEMASSYPALPATMGGPGGPPGPGAVSTPRGDPTAPTSHVDEHNRKYTLTVVQQPIRARMCGFGDKDRRPITPPPCILLTVTDTETGQPIDTADIDTTYYVLSVDLWSPDGTKEINLVRHSATSPSISATTSSSYPPTPSPIVFPYGPPLTQMHIGLAGPWNAPAQPGYGGAPAPPHHAHQAAGGPPPPPPQSYYTTTAGAPITPTNFYTTGGPHPGAPLLSPTGMPTPTDPRGAPGGMFTRNLIGSLTVNAFTLTDPDGKLGIWFILQDLSIRTEGTFRLKMSFVNVGDANATSTENVSGASDGLNRGSAPILASCFSAPFQVFSAKKFPGVIESTALSKCFAGQGIKIPIRKDGPRREDDDE